MQNCDYKDAQQAALFVLQKSSLSLENRIEIKGYDFNKGIDYEALLNSYMSTGFQASHFAQAVEQINEMIASREEHLEGEIMLPYPKEKKRRACTIFLGYTSNLITSGVRESIRYLVEHDLVDCIVTSAGGVEEDLIKCLAPSYLGSFDLDGKVLRRDGLNRAGNILIPNDNYCRFEEWIMPILDKCETEQNVEGFSWSPSKLIDRLGAEINDVRSVCYWAHKNRIPIFSPALTDGSLGDMLYFHSFRNGGIKLDIVEDVRHINTMAVRSNKTGVILLGGGVVKHHINNANLMRNGSDYTVYVNTGQEFDGSDSGARPDEAVSWGKIKEDCKPVKVFADVSLVFPLLVAKTFARFIEERRSRLRFVTA
ncbi:unnamed protein product [Thelazia callipaeda]|uniref:deoxyhypusine synthase n=1 Tax=Thelazia callipaeda TaxID=103827 RepID=A0A0N5D530_THECL|nr:unnamed protein product [Thelazia callipaeda]